MFKISTNFSLASIAKTITSTLVEGARSGSTRMKEKQQNTAKTALKKGIYFTRDVVFALCYSNTE